MDTDQLSDAIATENGPRMQEFYRGELFLDDEDSDFLAFFQSTRQGRAVGIVALTITEEDMR